MQDFLTGSINNLVNSHKVVVDHLNINFIMEPLKPPRPHHGKFHKALCTAETTWHWNLTISVILAFQHHLSCSPCPYSAVPFCKHWTLTVNNFCVNGGDTQCRRSTSCFSLTLSFPYCCRHLHLDATFHLCNNFSTVLWNPYPCRWTPIVPSLLGEYAFDSFADTFLSFIPFIRYLQVFLALACVSFLLPL